MEWILQHPEAARQVADAGRHFVRTYLAMDVTYAYAAALLNVGCMALCHRGAAPWLLALTCTAYAAIGPMLQEYAKLMAFEPALTPTSYELDLEHIIAAREIGQRL
eukprot:scaffold734_cov352-Prasinococcus_capsulatus_cf.AAC.2